MSLVFPQIPTITAAQQKQAIAIRTKLKQSASSSSKDSDAVKQFLSVQLLLQCNMNRDEVTALVLTPYVSR